MTGHVVISIAIFIFVSWIIGSTALAVFQVFTHGKIFPVDGKVSRYLDTCGNIIMFLVFAVFSILILDLFCAMVYMLFRYGSFFAPWPYWCIFH